MINLELPESCDGVFIYRLYSGDETVYVGQTKNLKTRVVQSGKCRNIFGKIIGGIAIVGL